MRAMIRTLMTDVNIEVEEFLGGLSKEQRELVDKGRWIGIVDASRILTEAMYEVDIESEAADKMADALTQLAARGDSINNGKVQGIFE